MITRIVRPLGLLLPLVPFLASCSILGLRKEVTTLESRGGVTIQVKPTPVESPPTYALAWRMENGQRKDSVGLQQVKATGLASFELSLDNTYRVGAFTDENNNGAFDAGEPLGLVLDVKPISLTDPFLSAKILPVEMKRDHGLAAGTVIKVPKENKSLGGKINIALGEVASLTEKRFQTSEGGQGLWRPLEFLSENAVGVYFTEPFDPKRIPVVFVYGIGGSPQDWNYMIDNIDRSRFQLWFFQYPSGMRLDKVSNTLATSLRILKQRHGFLQCYVVAHSMGGLVSRRAIDVAVADHGSNFIPKFVTISTPWGGHSAAEAGLRHLKKPIPSWKDVAPNSAYLQTLYATPPPSATKHWILYGHKTKNLPWLKGENDGVVLVDSETDHRIKRHAVSALEYPFQHEEILQQEIVLDRLEGILTNE